MPGKLGRVRGNGTYVDVVFHKSSGAKRGKIRLKANRVLWASANQKGWRGVGLRDFMKFMKTRGKPQTK